MDAGLGAESGEDLIGRFDAVEHDPGNTFFGEVGEVGGGVVFAFQVLAPTGFCFGRVGGR